MAVFTDPLVWCVVQITLVGLLAWALCAALRRWSAAGNAAVPAAALAAIVLLTICAFAPWPGWWTFGPKLAAWRADATSSSDPAARLGENPAAILSDEAVGDTPSADTDGPTDTSSPPAPVHIEATAADTKPDPAAPAPRFTVPAWLGSGLAVLLGIGIVAGALQIVGGLLSVRACRRHSRPVIDAELHEQLDILQAELGLARHIELRESDRLTTAATCGWRRPMVLLPRAWREWTAEQRRAVLAHELAHVAGGDYLTCVLAQLGLALHFYHPLVHWLVARLRLEQELAADRAAASLTGGPRAYLTTLAELALHSQERSLGWPAHTFLPTPGTFLRRIEMLRDSKPALSAPPRRRWAVKWLAVGLLLAGAAMIAGLRGGPAVSPFDREAAAQGQPATATGAAAAAVIDVTHVPNDARLLLALRPKEALAQDEIKSALDAGIGEGPSTLKLLTAEHLQQVTAFGASGLDFKEFDDQLVVILQFSQPTTIDDLTKAGYLPADMKRFPAGDDAPGGFVCGVVNEKTLALGSGQSLQRYLANRRKGKPAIAAGAGWEKVQKGTIVAAIDMEVIRDALARHKPEADAAAQIGALAPLWQDSEYLVAGIILEGKQVHFRAVATCDNGELAAEVAETTQAAVTLARNSLRSLREREAAAPALARLGLQTAEGLLKTMKIERSETLVVAQTSTTVPEIKSVTEGGLVGAVASARNNARRQVSMNNLKQIMLAMHSWADVHGHFPPPVIYGKDGKGKVPHSWRVELLPYLDQAHLYEAYQFEESWDSEANKKILAQMPQFYRHPMDDANSTHASYFVLVPEELLGAAAEKPVPTAFAKRDGVRFADIIDGTSNTLAVVEAKREIPWTRPDDIVFDAEKAPPTLGGFFKEGYLIGVCDGSVRFLDTKVEPSTLKALISPQGGEVIPVLP
jgi:beta-lactamase regulating signal transducer with metallopeptidase domain